MTELKHSSESSQGVPEMQEENELSALAEELRMAMANDARSVVPNQIPRRAFLSRILQVSLPAGVILASGGTAHACWTCDESYGCQAGCLLCNESAGCRAECLLYVVPPPCTTVAKIGPCPADFVCTWDGLLTRLPPVEKSQSDVIQQSDVTQQLEFER